MTSFTTLDPTVLTEHSVLAGRDNAVTQVRWMRDYTMQLIESVPFELWYQKPSGSATHLAWQVGHIAVAQYGLMLFRQRGRTENDMELMPGWLRKNFGKGSTPMLPDEKNPTPQSLLDRLQAIHQQSCVTCAELSFQTLLEPIDMPYAGYPNKLGALLFAPMHEAIHAGQVGLLRRLHGLDPVR